MNRKSNLRSRIILATALWSMVGSFVGIIIVAGIVVFLAHLTKNPRLPVQVVIHTPIVDPYIGEWVMVSMEDYSGVAMKEEVQAMNVRMFIAKEDHRYHLSLLDQRSGGSSGQGAVSEDGSLLVIIDRETIMSGYRKKGNDHLFFRTNEDSPSIIEFARAKTR